MTIYTCERCGAKSLPIAGPYSEEQRAWDEHECPPLVTIRQRGHTCLLCGNEWYQQELDGKIWADGCFTESCPNCLDGPEEEAFKRFGAVVGAQDYLCLELLGY